MNIKKLLDSNNCSYSLKYNPTSTSNVDIYSDSIELYTANGKCHVLSSSDETHSFLHFLGLDTSDYNINGQDEASNLYSLLCSYSGDKESLIQEYIDLCKKQPFLLIYLKGVHLTILGRNNTCRENLLELLETYDDIRQFIINILISPYRRTNAYSPQKLMLLNEHFHTIKNTESVFLRLFSRYHSLDLSPNINSVDEYLDKIITYSELVSKQLGTNDEDSFTILYNEKNTCDYKFHIVFVEFTQYMLENDLIIKYCPNCSKYFISKYQHRTVFCMRIYAKTKATCQEHASRLQYRKRKNENPIHPIYVSCYNKLYARVRKGKLEKDSPLFQTLNRLRDEYTSKYEENPSDILIDEFKRITKEL